MNRKFKGMYAKLLVMMCAALVLLTIPIIAQTIRDITIQVANEMWLDANEVQPNHGVTDLEIARDLHGELSAKLDRLNALFSNEMENLIAVDPNLSAECREELRDIEVGGLWALVEYACDD